MKQAALKDFLIEPAGGLLKEQYKPAKSENITSSSQEISQFW